VVAADFARELLQRGSRPSSPQSRIVPFPLPREGQGETRDAGESLRNSWQNLESRSKPYSIHRSGAFDKKACLALFSLTPRLDPGQRP
jgi:hypothetical protein